MITDFAVQNVALGIISIFVLYRYILYPSFISPLSKIPNAHWSASISSFWILWIRWCSKEIATIHDAHRRLGPVIRLSVSEISVNCVRGGIQTVYAGGFEKHEWYSNLFDNYG
jgi:hypothetical protein